MERKPLSAHRPQAQRHMARALSARAAEQQSRRKSSQLRAGINLSHFLIGNAGIFQISLSLACGAPTRRRAARYQALWVALQHLAIAHNGTQKCRYSNCALYRHSADHTVYAKAGLPKELKVARAWSRSKTPDTYTESRSRSGRAQGCSGFRLRHSGASQQRASGF